MDELFTPFVAAILGEIAFGLMAFMTACVAVIKLRRQVRKDRSKALHIHG